MLTCEALARIPSTFRSLTGMNPPEVERLRTDFTAAHQRQQAATRCPRRGQPRPRAAGAGHPPKHAARHRLLLALIWLRVYPTYELFGFWFGLHKRNAQLNVRAVTVGGSSRTARRPVNGPRG